MSGTQLPDKLFLPRTAPHLAYDDFAGGCCHLVANGEARDETLKRAVECYNACVGITDPEHAIKSAVGLLQRAVVVFQCMPPAKVGEWNWEQLAEDTQQALNQLVAAKKEGSGV